MFPVISGSRADGGKLQILLVWGEKKKKKKKIAMKGVFLSSGPKALVGTKRDTLCFSFVFSFVEMRRSLVCIQKKWLCADLFFYTPCL